MSQTTTVAEFVAKSRWEDCPPAAVEAALRAILDCLGVMLAGSVDAPARIVQAVAEAEGGAPLLHRDRDRPRRTGATRGRRWPTAPRRTRWTSTTRTLRCSGIRRRRCWPPRSPLASSRWPTAAR